MDLIYWKVTMQTSAVMFENYIVPGSNAKEAWNFATNQYKGIVTAIVLAQGEKGKIEELLKKNSAYLSVDCPNCSRRRVQSDGVCEKCLWDLYGNDYASITRPDNYDTNGYIFKGNENDIFS